LNFINIPIANVVVDYCFDDTYACVTFVVFLYGLYA